MHGKTSPIFHDSKTVFRTATGISRNKVPFAGRDGHTRMFGGQRANQDGIVMGCVIGTTLWKNQFHPESIMTVVGKQLLANFMERR
jgi:para-aminobenzoate synthetase component 2